MKRALRLLICYLALSVPAQTLWAFPSESELKQSLKPNMQIYEVTKHFGEPNEQFSKSDGSFTYRYRAAFGELTADREGYIGFELHFIQGRLRDWRTLRGNPSFRPLKPPSVLKWYGWGFLLLFVGMALFRAARQGQDAAEEDHALMLAYADRRILTQHLPEFRFITHETTLQEVVDRVGPPSQQRDLSLNLAAGTAKTEACGVAGLTIPLSEYSLPYGAAAIVMPEYPYDIDNKIRATYYRPPRPDEEMPT